MNSFFKATVILFLSTQTFAAVNQLNLEQIKKEISLIREDVTKDCNASKEMIEASSVACRKAVKSAHKGICSKKMEMVSYFEAITSDDNIKRVQSRFGSTPPADALGGVLLWQMRSSIDQVNSYWSREADKMKSKSLHCVSTDIKKEVVDYTSYIKEYLSQTTLSVEPK